MRIRISRAVDVRIPHVGWVESSRPTMVYADGAPRRLGPPYTGTAHITRQPLSLSEFFRIITSQEKNLADRPKFLRAS